MPSARYSVRSPKGPGPAPENFSTQRPPSPVSTSAGLVLAWGRTARTRATVSPGPGDGEGGTAAPPLRRSSPHALSGVLAGPLWGAQIFLLVK